MKSEEGPQSHRDRENAICGPRTAGRGGPCPPFPHAPSTCTWAQVESAVRGQPGCWAMGAEQATATSLPVPTPEADRDTAPHP